MFDEDVQQQQLQHTEHRPTGLHVNMNEIILQQPEQVKQVVMCLYIPLSVSV